MGNDTEKFLFNQHIFDEPDVDEEEELEEPPPPTYSQEELESAREDTYKRAYEQGKKDGIAESLTSREQMVAETLQKISQETHIIFAAESERERIFEQESVKLASVIFEKLFPEQKEIHGFDELRLCLSSILKKQENQSEIRIETHPDVASGIKELIDSMQLINQAEQRFDIIDNDKLDGQAIKIYWKDGGAIKDIESIAHEIRTILHDTLASEPLNSHDGNMEVLVDQPTSETAHDQNKQEQQLQQGIDPAKGEPPVSGKTKQDLEDTKVEKPDE